MLLRLILIFFVLLILFRLFYYAFVRPFLQGYLANNQTTGSKKHKQKKEGEITIDYVPKKEKQYDKKTGDYVDFKDVKD